MDRIEYKPDLFVNRDDELSKLTGAVRDIQDGNPAQRVWHICGHATQGKSWLMRHLQLECESNSGGKVEFTYFPKSRGADLDEKLAALNGKQKTFLCAFDGLDTLPREEFLKLEDTTLAKLAQRDNVVLLLGSRQKLDAWRVFALRPSEEKIIWLEGFNKQDTQKQLTNLVKERVKGFEKLSVDLAFVNDVYSVSDGVPGLNALVARNWKRTQGNKTKIAELCLEEILPIIDIQRVLGYDEDEAVRFLDTMKALSVLIGFVDEEEMMPVLQGCALVRSTDRVWDRRTCLLLIRSMEQLKGARGFLLSWDAKKEMYVMDKEIRRLLSVQLFTEDRDRWTRLTCMVMKMYREWAVTYGGRIFQELAEEYESSLREFGLTKDDCSKT